MVLRLRLDKGAAEVMRGLFSGDPDQVAEAVAFQRETFRARFGCYPEECREIPYEELTEEEQRG